MSKRQYSKLLLCTFDTCVYTQGLNLVPWQPLPGSADVEEEKEVILWGVGAFHGKHLKVSHI